MKYRVSIDTGGTFTDAVIYSEKQTLTVGKSLTTPKRAYDGVKGAIKDAASQLNISLEELLTNTEIFIYGTTRATNAIITGTGAKTAFLTTKGFAHTLILKEGGKSKPHDFSKNFPKPYIPKERTFEIIERISSEGTISIPLDEKQATEIILHLGELGFEAIAVSFLWSIANPIHELKIGRMIGKILPKIPYSLGHKLTPILREYRRASSVAIDASLKPLMQDHLINLEKDLKKAGYRGEFLISTSAGGCAQVKDIVEYPIHTAKSGPAQAPVAARMFGNLEKAGSNYIVCDTGGTTFDVGLITNNKLRYSRDTWLGGDWIGHILSISSVDISSIGAGGGSIAWFDDGGLLRVGPQSAGAQPGPACYGQGGNLPTVSDAACVLGYFNPDFFLGGQMNLDIKAAREAIESIATQLNKTIEEAAYGILHLASEVMINAVRDVTITKGIDPKESVIVAGGGAAGINIMLIAMELGISKVILPKQASALSACGMQFADLISEESESFFTHSKDFNGKAVNSVINRIKKRVEKFRLSLPIEHRKKNYKMELSVEARYASQVWEIEVPVPSGDFENSKIVNKLMQNFHKVHEHLFALRDEGSAIEFIVWKIRLLVESGIKLTENKKNKKNKNLKLDNISRYCYFGSKKSQKTKIFKSNNLFPGMLIKGPCIIEEPSTTVVVFPGMSATVSNNNHYILNCNYDQNKNE